MQYKHVTFTGAYGTADQLPFSARSEISFVGRSNVGKSSIMNKIFNRKNLVKVSSKPGKTSTINFFNVDDVDFVDLPGYGFAQVSDAEKKRWKELIDGYFTQERRFALTVLLVDIRHDVSKLDLQMIDFLMDHQRPFVICFTKIDKFSKNKLRAQIGKLCKQMSRAGDTTVLAVSAFNGEGVGDLRAVLEDAAKQEQAAC